MKKAQLEALSNLRRRWIEKANRYRSRSHWAATDAESVALRKMKAAGIEECAYSLAETIRKLKKL